MKRSLLIALLLIASFSSNGIASSGKHSIAPLSEHSFAVVASRGDFDQIVYYYEIVNGKITLVDSLMVGSVLRSDSGGYSSDFDDITTMKNHVLHPLLKQ